jgi:hypothetical protein
MRMRVLSGEHKERKVREIDDALKSLDVLYMPEGAEKPVFKQETLFGG